MIELLIGIIAMVAVLNFFFDRYENYKKARKEEFNDKMNVLKIISKDECYGLFHKNEAHFEQWFTNFLTLKGYVKDSITCAKDSSGKDFVAEDKEGKKVYIQCNLSDPRNWDECVSRADAERLVGAMYGDGIKKGMIVTTGKINNEAKSFIKKVGERGLDIELLDGDDLMAELYYMRRIHLKEPVQAY